MIKSSCAIVITCDARLEACTTQKEYSGEDRFHAVNSARIDGWYIANSGFSLCGVHDNARKLELIEHEKMLTQKQRDANTVVNHDVYQRSVCGAVHPDLHGLFCRLNKGHSGTHSTLTGPDEHWTS